MSTTSVEFTETHNIWQSKAKLSANVIEFVASGVSNVNGNPTTFEVFRPLGDPMILLGANQRPIAALHFRGAAQLQSNKSANAAASPAPVSTVYFRKNEQKTGDDAEIEYFHGLINRSGAFELVLTNLLGEGRVKFHVFVDESSNQVNDINDLRPYESVVVKQNASSDMAQLLLLCSLFCCCFDLNTIE